MPKARREVPRNGKGDNVPSGVVTPEHGSSVVPLFR